MTNKHIFFRTSITYSLILLLSSWTDCLPARASSEIVVHSFKGSPTDGSGPMSGLSGDSAGNGYGTTVAGGSYTYLNAGGYGTVYKITPTGTLTMLYYFSGWPNSFTGSPTDGAYPYGGLTLGKDGNFYGTTEEGSSYYVNDTYGFGTVYRITPTGQLTILYAFTNFLGDGAYPYAGLTLGKDGNFYGTTYAGGMYSDAYGDSYGTVFKITPTGQETVIHSFMGNTDGANPYAGLIQGTDGNFYGTTYYGGTSGSGTVFKITPTGVLTILCSFTGTNGDGANPQGGVIQGKDGNFYGTTFLGGITGYGTVFKVTPTGVLTILHSFTNTKNDGIYPLASLFQGKDGNFYGTTEVGGTYSDAYGYGGGTVFKITPAGQETVVHSFGAAGDGTLLYSGLIQDKNGYIYGTTSGGGAYGGGTIFRITL